MENITTSQMIKVIKNDIEKYSKNEIFNKIKKIHQELGYKTSNEIKEFSKEKLISIYMNIVY